MEKTNGAAKGSGCRLVAKFSAQLVKNNTSGNNIDPSYQWRPNHLSIGQVRFSVARNTVSALPSCSCMHALEPMWCKISRPSCMEFLTIKNVSSSTTNQHHSPTFSWSKKIFHLIQITHWGDVTWGTYLFERKKPEWNGYSFEPKDSDHTGLNSSMDHPRNFKSSMINHTNLTL